MFSVYAWHFDIDNLEIGWGLGGFLVGKMMGQQKFFWGVVIGAAYFLILFLIGVGVMGTKINGNMQIISGAMVCVISGMLGGMIAPGGKSA